ncbi:MAG TPA: Ku protein [Eubacteriales bacterium]|nr:Ku protein [Eubacteriales bacterium]
MAIKSSISFGLVYIPVELQNTIKNNDIGFNMIDKKTMSRIKYKKTCVDCEGREVKQEDIVKGFEYERGKYVILEEEELEKIKTQKQKSIVIERFVDLDEIDALYFDKTYYLAPTGAEKAFTLLLKAMNDEKKAGIAKTVLGAKETLIVIRARGGEMLLSTLYFKEEVRPNPAKNIGGDVSDKELSVAKTIIKTMAGKFDPEEYRDEYREKLVAAIEKKISGKEIETPKERPQYRVANRMDALESTLKGLGKPTPPPKKTSRPRATN